LNEHLEISFAPGENPEGRAGSKAMNEWSAELRQMIQSMLPTPTDPDPGPGPPTNTIVLNDAIQVRAPATNVSFKSRSYGGARLSRKRRV
jgi:hypothetical protein